ncbi:MAG: hypothetical protein JHC87_07270, partial [Thermoleophilaceae bacterium]|nr:hypothetical protein [Thermoleophilaceae bacterium]
MNFNRSHVSNMIGSTVGNRSARFVMLALMPLVLALALMPAAASAFSNTQFDVVPSTTQAAAHPNLVVTLNRRGSESEDIKNAVVDLPPGLLANANAITSKCSSFYFSIDACSSSTQVGSLSVDIVALGLLPLSDVGGGIYLLSPNSTDAATLGYVLRPIGSQIGIINKAYIKNNVTIRTDDQGLKNSHISLPTTTAAILIVPVPITINKMKITYQARTGSGNNGNYFMINSSSCLPGTAKMRLDSYQGVSVYNSTTITPTGCGSVPFDPSFAQTITDKRAEQSTATSVQIAEDQTAAAIQRSNLKKATIDFPAGTGLDFAVVNALTACTEAQFQANGCPTTSKIGTVNAGIPYLPPNFTGSVYALNLDNQVAFGIALAGPRGITAKLHGAARVTGVGPAQHVQAIVDNNPQVPLSTFTLNFSSKLIQNPATCTAPHVTTAVLEGWSGASVTKTASYSTTDCAPDTSITSGPG